MRFRHMKRTVALLAVALLAASFTPNTADAKARCVGVSPQSIFGTVTAVRSGVFTLHTNAPVGDVNVYMPDRDVRTTGGVALRPGVYAGVWGCLPSGSHDFISEEVTISSSEATYPAQYRYSNDDRFIEGRVDQIGPKGILVHGTARKDTWVVTNQTGFAVGQTVRARGRFQSDGDFTAITVDVVR